MAYDVSCVYKYTWTGGYCYVVVSSARDKFFYSVHHSIAVAEIQGKHDLTEYGFKVELVVKMRACNSGMKRRTLCTSVFP